MKSKSIYDLDTCLASRIRLEICVFQTSSDIKFNEELYEFLFINYKASVYSGHLIRALVWKVWNLRENMFWKSNGRVTGVLWFFNMLITTFKFLKDIPTSHIKPLTKLTINGIVLDNSNTRDASSEILFEQWLFCTTTKSKEVDLINSIYVCVAVFSLCPLFLNMYIRRSQKTKKKKKQPLTCSLNIVVFLTVGNKFHRMT